MHVPDLLCVCVCVCVQGRKASIVEMHHAACIWKVRMKCVVDLSSLIIVGGLERNVALRRMWDVSREEVMDPHKWD